MGVVCTRIAARASRADYFAIPMVTTSMNAMFFAARRRESAPANRPAQLQRNIAHGRRGPTINIVSVAQQASAGCVEQQRLGCFPARACEDRKVQPPAQRRSSSSR